MNATTSPLGSLIASQKDELARLIVDEQWARNPHFHQTYGERGHRKCVEDVTYNLSYLAESVSAGSSRLFEAYIDWVTVLFKGLGIPREELGESLEITAEVLRQRFPESAPLLESFLTVCAKQLAEEPAEPPSFISEGAPLGTLARDYLDLLRNGHRTECSQLILAAVEDGTSVRDIYLNVFQPTQREIGRLWQMSQLSVAEEHYCTAATQLIMSQLSSHVFGAKRIGKSLVATCVGGELHEIGLRMVADIFEMDGWDTYYLGSNTPNASIVETLKARNPDLLLVSTTMTFNVKHVVSLIEAVRASDVRSDLPILVGGYPFNIEPELWKQIGASGYASSALGAVEVAGKLAR